MKWKNVYIRSLSCTQQLNSVGALKHKHISFTFNIFVWKIRKRRTSRSIFIRFGGTLENAVMMKFTKIEMEVEDNKTNGIDFVKMKYIPVSWLKY